MNVMFQRVTVTTEATQQKLSNWNCWLQNIVDGHDTVFKRTTTHTCADGRGGVADLIGVEVTVEELTRPVMTDSEIETASHWKQ